MLPIYHMMYDHTYSKKSILIYKPKKWGFDLIVIVIGPLWQMVFNNGLDGLEHMSNAMQW